jgi:hypothetical protein
VNALKKVKKSPAKKSAAKKATVKKSPAKNATKPVKKSTKRGL